MLQRVTNHELTSLDQHISTIFQEVCHAS